jgi:hypothetical protein
MFTSITRRVEDAVSALATVCLIAPLLFASAMFMTTSF